jgi:hypothetical protein
VNGGADHTLPKLRGLPLSLRRRRECLFGIRVKMTRQEASWLGSPLKARSGFVPRWQRAAGRPALAINSLVPGLICNHNSRPMAAVPSISGPASWPRELLRWAKTGLPRCKKRSADLHLKARHTAPTSIGYR